MLSHDSLKSITIEHGKDLALVGHLHGRGIIITVAGNHILPDTLSGNHKLFAQFA